MAEVEVRLRRHQDHVQELVVLYVAKIPLQKKAAQLRHTKLQVIAEGRREVRIYSAQGFQVPDCAFLVCVKPHQDLDQREIFQGRCVCLQKSLTMKNLRSSTFGIGACSFPWCWLAARAGSNSSRMRRIDST